MNGLSNTLGWVQRFRPGERDRVEALLPELARLGISHVRTGLSRAVLATEGGALWYDWLLARLSRDVDVLPCLRCAPGYPVDQVHEVLARYGDRFAALELCVGGWDELDAGFVAELTAAAGQVRRAGKRVLLGGVPPGAPELCDALGGLLASVDAIGLHVEGDPASGGWEDRIAAWREAIALRGASAEVWISRGGGRFGDGGREVRAMAEALASSAERVYWFGLAPTPAPERRPPRPIARRLLGSGGAARVLAAGRLSAWRRPGAPYALVTGGAGFVGSNVADRLLSEGREVVILDDLSRAGVERNARWLEERHGQRVHVEIADVRDDDVVRELVRGADQVFHLAAQVAVTTSLVDPIDDFEVNARGTLTLLEALRALPAPPPLVYSSTNKVYGDLDDVALTLRGDRYEPDDVELRSRGIDESRALRFHSPYGCSKGAADQYVLDYARTFGLPACVFRMSCVYGPRQFGTEDQGWVAHFMLRALERRPITLYGDGCQVRDVLYVDDLVDAFVLARDKMHVVAGRAFNLGGGVDNAISLREVLDDIEELCGERPDLSIEGWRPADQRYYVSDCRSFRHATGWWPQVSVGVGLARLHRWLRDSVARLPEEPTAVAELAGTAS